MLTGPRSHPSFPFQGSRPRCLFKHLVWTQEATLTSRVRRIQGWVYALVIVSLCALLFRLLFTLEYSKCYLATSMIFLKSSPIFDNLQKQGEALATSAAFASLMIFKDPTVLLMNVMSVYTVYTINGIKIDIPQ